jgi:hypothetical protein
MRTDTAPDTGHPSLFDGATLALDVFRAVRRALEEIGDAELHVTSSQVAFHRRRPFAYLSMPGERADRLPVTVVLSIVLDHELRSPRCRDVVERTYGGWVHHLDVRTVVDVDDEVTAWLADAWTAAGTA